jgi:LysR family transcriptional regulator, hydrogen peroxide-inducible genes activator
MQTHQVRYFLTLARTLNFTKAAEECNVSQPSLTRAIKKLEEEFGGPLFRRERANTHLTSLGCAMFPHLEQSYLAAQSACALAEAFKRGDVAVLRLGLSNAVSSHLFTEIFNGVRSRVPNFALAVDGGSETDLRDAMLKGNSDLVVQAEDGATPERIKTWPLFTENFQIIAPAAHRLASKTPLILQDLDGEDVIERTKCVGCLRLRQLCAASGTMPRFRHRVDSIEQLLSLVRAGFGVGLVPRSDHLGDGLVGREIEKSEIDRKVSLATVAGRPVSAATDAFMKLSRMRDWAADKIEVHALTIVNKTASVGLDSVSSALRRMKSRNTDET